MGLYCFGDVRISIACFDHFHPNCGPDYLPIELCTSHLEFYVGVFDAAGHQRWQENVIPSCLADFRLAEQTLSIMMSYIPSKRRLFSTNFLPKSPFWSFCMCTPASVSIDVAVNEVKFDDRRLLDTLHMKRVHMACWAPKH